MTPREPTDDRRPPPRLVFSTSSGGEQSSGSGGSHEQLSGGHRIPNHLRPVSVSDRGAALFKKACDQARREKDETRGFLQVAKPTSDDSEPLSDQLLTLRRTSYDGREYFPCGSVEALITKEVVIKALTAERHSITGRQLSDEEIASYAATICSVQLPNGKWSSYQKLFAILVLLSRCWDIVALVDYELSLSDGSKVRICDAHLPLLAVPTNPTGTLVRMRLPAEPKTNLECFKHWSSVIHKNFEDNQWSVLSPFFAQGEKHHVRIYQLSTKDVLPFTMVDRNEPLAGGGYSYVSHVKIDPCHHNFDESIMSDGTFAVKHIKASAYYEDAPTPQGPSGASGSGPHISRERMQQLIQMDFEHEIGILNMFSGPEEASWNMRRFDSRKHLITLLVAFQRGDEWCLVFRWAQSDLLKMWRVIRPEAPRKDDKKALAWVLEQCKGLAGGIQRIHLHTTTESRTKDQLLGPREEKIYGRHGDIKPENILHFVDKRYPTQLGSLVITDFGLCRFHHENTKSYVPKRDIQRTPTYRPPECDMKGSKISRSFDIWSFGCVLLEFFTWYLGGWALLEEFVNSRKVPSVLMHGFSSDQFFELVTPLKETGKKQFIRVKTEVIQFVHNRLHTHPHCTDIIHHILDFVMKEMIVVESHGALNRERATCSMVYNMLSEQYALLENLPDQLVFTPWSPPKGTLDESVAVQMVLEEDAAKTMSSREDQIRKHTGPTIILPDGVPLEGSRSPSRASSPGASPRRTQTS